MLIVRNILLMCLSVILISSFIVKPSSAAAAGQFVTGTYGGKTYKLFIHGQYDENTSYPLYVMLHGCTQDANQFAAGTQMNALAEEKGFLVLYPEQNSAANSNKCWNWFETSHQSRGSGEPSVIAGMVQAIKGSYSIQNEQVYVAGLSAGGAMSVIMGAAYPDIFSGVGVGAGLEYKAATSTVSAFTAMSNGGPNPVQQGRLAYQEMGSRAELMPVIVFHGTSDYTVNSINGTQVISQWSVTNDLAANGSEDGWIDGNPEKSETLQVPAGRSYTVNEYNGEDGKVWMKRVFVDGMGHAWSGGSSQGSYTDPQGPNASFIMWEFFQTFVEDNENEPGTPVTVATPKGGMYSDAIYVELISNGSAATYYTIDGSVPTINSFIYTNPILISENTTLKFFSRDAVGNTEQIRVEEYIIQFDEPDPQEPIEIITLTSIAREDGFAGQYLADGMGSGDIKVGDKGMYNSDTYRGILSFDTSILGESDLQSAKIRLYKKSIQGSICTLQVDIKNGVYGSSSQIEQGDYSSPSTKSNIVQFTLPENEFVEIELPNSAFLEFNKNGRTQFRLKASSIAGFSPNTIEFYGGEHSDYAPQLIITTND
jgi:poly(hydroxyalkanoate) depolymerase family esterase